MRLERYDRTVTTNRLEWLFGVEGTMSVGENSRWEPLKSETRGCVRLWLSNQKRICEIGVKDFREILFKISKNDEPPI